MKDFYVSLKGVNKKDRKALISLLKSHGYEWGSLLRFKDSRYKSLFIYPKAKGFIYAYHTDTAVNIEKVAELIGFKIGEWYKAKEGDAFFNFQGGSACYGWFRGTWSTWHFNKDYGFMPATVEEVRQRLTKEAKKRYPTGTKVKCLRGWSDKKDETGVVGDGFNVCDGYISGKGSKYILTLYQNGKWAEVIKDSTPYEMNAQPAIDQIKELIKYLESWVSRNI